jgi:hypothetical protein
MISRARQYLRKYLKEIPMGQHQTPLRKTQIQKLQAEPQSSSPMTQQIKATVIGFSREDCKICFGRGRLGFDARYKDKVHIIPCKCVEFFDLETVQKSHDEAKQAAQKEIDAELAKLDKTSPIIEAEFNCGIRTTGASGQLFICPEHGESCGIKLPQTQSSSSSPSEFSSSSSSASDSTST